MESLQKGNISISTEGSYELANVAKADLLLIPNYKNRPCSNTSNDPVLVKKREVTEEEFLKVMSHKRVNEMNIWIKDQCSIPSHDIRRDSSVQILRFMNSSIEEILASGKIPISTIGGLIDLKTTDLPLYEFLKDSSTIKDMDFIIEALDMIIKVNKEKLIQTVGEDELSCMKEWFDGNALEVLYQEALIFKVKDLALFPEQYPYIYATLKRSDTISDIDNFINRAREMLDLGRLIEPSPKSNLNDYLKSLLKENARSLIVSKACSITILNNLNRLDEQDLLNAGVHTIEDLAHLHLNVPKFQLLSQQVVNLEELSDNALSLFTSIDK